MARNFAPITVDELKDKIKERITATKHNSAFVESFGSDIKVKFDLENFGCNGGTPDGLLGYQKLKNGLVFCGFRAGGDWEHPVFFIVYWDGKKLRAYVPTDGNPWNTTTKEAYGNDGEADFKNAMKRYPWMKEDFKERQAEFEDEELEEIVEPDEFCFDSDEIRSDICARILKA